MIPNVWLKEPYIQQEGVALTSDVCVISINCGEQPCNVTLSVSPIHRQICQKELDLFGSD